MSLELKINDANLTFNDNNELSVKYNPYVSNGGDYIPLRHPDLSTQPSILPYKFMGNYVYEQLIYMGRNKLDTITKSFSLEELPFEVKSPIILDIKGFGFAKPMMHDGEKHYFTDKYIGLPCDANVYWEDPDLNNKNNGRLVFTISSPKFKQTEKVVKNQHGNLNIGYYIKVIYTTADF